MNSSDSHTMYTTAEPWEYDINKDNFNCLMKFLSDHDITTDSVVLHTGWNKYKEHNASWLVNGKTFYTLVPKFRKMLGSAYRGITDHISHKDGGNKAKEIRKYISEHFGKAEDYFFVVIDDDVRESTALDTLNKEPNILFHPVDPNTGLTEKDLREIEREMNDKLDALIDFKSIYKSAVSV